MEGLYKLYADDLRPVLLDLERKRKNVFSNYLKVNLLTILLFAGGAVAYLTLMERMPFLAALLLVSILGTAYMIFCYRSVMKNHRMQVKQNIVGRVVKSIDSGLNYQANSWVSGLEIQVSGFFERDSWSDVKGEDLISGKLNGLGFKCSEIHLPRFVTEFRDGDLSRFNVRTKPFKGLFAIMELPKRLDSVVYIFPNNFGGKVNRTFSTVKGLERVKLEDPSFERHFNAYATDQLQSRMILTTRLIDDITSLRQRVGSDIMLGIQGNKLYIAVSSSKDLFEPNVRKSYLNPEQVRESLKELNIVIQLVEDVQQIFETDV